MRWRKLSYILRKTRAGGEFFNRNRSKGRNALEREEINIENIEKDRHTKRSVPTNSGPKLDL